MSIPEHISCNAVSSKLRVPQLMCPASDIHYCHEPRYDLAKWKDKCDSHFTVDKSLSKV